MIRSLCYLWIVASAALVISCATTRPVTSSVQASQINSLALLEPITYISLIEQGNLPQLNDSLSYESQLLISTLVRNVEGMPEIVEMLALPDDSVRNQLNSELESYMIALENAQPKNRHELPVPATITSVLNANGYRFGMAFVSQGFTRRRGNYGGQVAKGMGLAIATAILSGGMASYGTIPIKSRSNIACAIIDAQTGSVVFYNRHFADEADPMREDHVSKQLEKIFKEYWE